MIAKNVNQTGNVAAFPLISGLSLAEVDAALTALACCRTRRVALLVVKLNRLSRDARFLSNLVDGAGEAGVLFCDLSQVPPGPMGRSLLTQMAAVAELEAGLTGQRTRAALAAAKARGMRLGNPRLQPGTPAGAEVARVAHAELVQARSAELRAVLDGMRAEGVMPEGASLRQVAAALEARGVRAPQGGARWSAAQVRRMLDRNRS